jgi:protein TonB
MATRSVKVSMERRANGGLNDNYPSVLPGHELAGLDGVPRPPAAEAVAHYSRFTQISSYPDHPSEVISDASEPPVMDAVVDGVDRTSHPKKSVAFACLGSCLLHTALVVAALMLAIPSSDDAQQEEGDTLSVVMIGNNSDVDAKMAGEETKLQPEPEQVTAEAVQPNTVQPTEAEPVETQPVESSQDAQPVETTEAIQPTTEAVQPTAPETVSTTEPQILATQAPAETTVVQPATSEPLENEPTETTQAAEPPAEVVKPLEKPIQPKLKDVVKKQPVKVVKVKSGSGGDAARDSIRGSSEGTESAQSDKTAQADARRTGAGNAARSDYAGKIQACIRRAVRGISTKGNNTTVVMRFRVDASGRVLSPAILSGSGSPDIDQAVLVALRGVGSCSPIPSELGLSSMPFTIPFVIRR